MVTPPPAQGPTADMQRAVEQTSKVRALPQLPADTHDHVNALANAQDEGELVGRTVTMLIYFSEFEDWRDFTEQVLTFVRNGNKKGTLEYLKAFFDGLAAIHMIDPTLGERIRRAVGDHFEDIQAQLQDLPLGGDEITADDLLAGEDDDGPGEDDDDPGDPDDDPGEGDGGDEGDGE